jgi:hypothetical protein
MQVQLKVKHALIIADEIRTYSLERFGSLYSNLKSALIGYTDEEVTVTVECTADDIINVYSILTVMREGLMNATNQEMRADLEPQVGAGVVANDEDWIKIYNYIQDLDTSYSNELTAKKGRGKSFLGV